MVLTVVLESSVLSLEDVHTIVNLALVLHDLPVMLQPVMPG